jgi:hypothetical protein
MEESLTYGEKNFFGKIFSPSSYRKFELQKFELLKKVQFIEEKQNRENFFFQVIENSSYGINTTWKR